MKYESDASVTTLVAHISHQTKGTLAAAVESFVEWLDRQVQQREVKRAIELESDYGAAGTAKVVLIGHSMGGLLIADAIKSIRQIYREGPLWPRIIAVLAFDTPVRSFHSPPLRDSRVVQYLGINPNVFKDKASQGLSYASDLHSVISKFGGFGLAGASTPKSSTPSAPVVPAAAAATSGWQRWAAIGGAAVVASGTAAAAYYHKDKITSGVTFGMSFVTDQ